MKMLLHTVKGENVLFRMRKLENGDFLTTRPDKKLCHANMMAFRKKMKTLQRSGLEMRKQENGDF